MTVASKIKSYLIGNGIKQNYLSAKTGISTTKLNMALNGHRRLKFDEYETICWALNVGVDQFIEPKAPSAKT